MSLLEELIQGASGEAVAVATLLRKVKVLASRLGTGQLAEWVEHELVGYPPESPLPAYRGPFKGEVLGHFGGYFGSGMRNAPVPSIAFPKDFRDGPLFNFELRQSISELERLSGGKSPLQSNWPADAVAYTNALIQRGDVQLYEGMGLQQAWQVISATHVGGIVDTVRTRILDLALSMEEVEPQAGRPGTKVPAERIHQIVTNVYGGAPNIAVASDNVTQTVQFPAKGDLEGLIANLAEIGITESDLDDLRSAISVDQNEDVHAEGPGPRVSAWLGRIALKTSSLAGKVGVGAAGGLAARAIAAYFGLP